MKNSLIWLKKYLEHLTPLFRSYSSDLLLFIDTIDKLLLQIDAGVSEEELMPEYFEFKNSLHDCITSVAFKIAQSKVKNLEDWIILLLANKRRIDCNFKGGVREAILAEARTGLMRCIRNELSHPIFLQTIVAYKQELPVNIFSETSLSDIPDSFGASTYSHPIHDGSRIIFSRMDKDALQHPENIKFKQDSEEQLLMNCVFTANIAGRNYKGGKLGSNQGKPLIRGSQREIVNLMGEYIDQLSNDSTPCDIKDKILTLWEKVKSNQFDQKGLCNGVAGFGVLEALGFRILLPSSGSVTVSVLQLLQTLLSTSLTMPREQFLVMLDIIYHLMEPSDLNPKLRQNHFFEACIELQKRGCLILAEGGENKSFHIGCLTTADRMERLLDNLHTGDCVRVATGEHAISIFKKGQYYYLIEPNQDILTALTLPLEKNDCASHLFSLICSSTRTFTMKVHLALGVSVYSSSSILNYEASHKELYQLLAVTENYKEMIPSRTVINRGATGLLMAVTVNDILGVKTYCGYVDAVEFIYKRYDTGSDIEERHYNSLERAVQLQFTECTLIMVDTLLKSGKYLSDIICEFNPSNVQGRSVSIIEYALEIGADDIFIELMNWMEPFEYEQLRDKLIEIASLKKKDGLVEFITTFKPKPKEERIKDMSTYSFKLGYQIGIFPHVEKKIEQKTASNDSVPSPMLQPSDS